MSPCGLCRQPELLPAPKAGTCEVPESCVELLNQGGPRVARGGRVDNESHEQNGTCRGATVHVGRACAIDLEAAQPPGWHLRLICDFRLCHSAPTIEFMPEPATRHL